MRDLYPQDDPRFVAARVLVDAEEEEDIGRYHDLHAFMQSLGGGEFIIHIHEDLDDEMVLRATYHPLGGVNGKWEVFEVETEMSVLQQAQELLDRLAPTKLAAAATFCLLKMKGGSHGYESLSLGELDTITDTDPELN